MTDNSITQVQRLRETLEGHETLADWGLVCWLFFLAFTNNLLKCDASDETTLKLLEFQAMGLSLHIDGLSVVKNPKILLTVSSVGHTLPFFGFSTISGRELVLQWSVLYRVYTEGSRLLQNLSGFSFNSIQQNSVCELYWLHWLVDRCSLKVVVCCKAFTLR